MPWREAAEVARMVLLFAETGQGRVTRMHRDPRGLWLYVGRFKVRLRVDAEADQIEVLYVWRVR